jgi:hypothetical protein
MRKLAIAQLGTNDKFFDEKKFVEVLVEQTIRKIAPHALRAAAKTAKGKRKTSLEEAALRCERDGDLGSAKNARRAAYAASAIYASASASAYASAYLSAPAVTYADAAADAACAAAHASDDDIALNISADIGVQALRAAGAHGIKLMDQLIPA